MKRILFALFYALAAGYVYADVLQVNQFSGLNTDDSPLDLQNGQSPDSENVLTDDGPGVKGRNGFVRYSTEPSSGLWEFPVSDGTRYLITRSGGSLKATTTSRAGVFSIAVSTVPTDRVVAAAVLGDRFYFADTLNGLKYWNGTSVVVASASLTVDKLVTFKGRLVAAGKSAAGRTLFLSKYLDGTSWNAPTNASDDDAAQIVVAGALDENIQGLYATFQDKLMWFKSNSFGAIYGSRRSNFIQRTFSDRVGVSSPETIQDCDGKLRWLGANRQVWEFDGSTFGKISEDVDALFAQVTQGDSATRSLTDTSQTDFEEGVQSPTGTFDTTTTPGTLTPKTSTFADTLAADFATGTDSPSGYTTAVAATLHLGTSTAVASFADTAQADFAAGTLTNCTANADGTVTNTAASIVLGTLGVTGSAGTVCTTSHIAQQFLATGTFLASSVSAVLSKVGTVSDAVLTIRADSAGSPGSVLATAVVPAASLPAGTGSMLTASLNSAITLSAGTTYWLYMQSTGTTCSIPNSVQWDNTVGVYTLKAGANGSYATTIEYSFRVTGTSYQTAGNIVSRSYDVGAATTAWIYNFGTFTANSTAGGGSVAYQTQTSADGSTWNTLTAVASGAQPTSPIGRYVRYKATLTGGATYTPTLSDVTLSFSAQLRPSATFTSRGFDTGFTAPIWGLLSNTLTTLGTGGTATFYTQSSGDGVSWDARVAASTSTQIASARKRYLRYQVDLAATNATSYVKVDDITLIAKSTGVFTSAAFSLGSLVTAWGPFSWSASDNGGALTVKIATSTDGITFSSFTAISNGGTPTVSTAPYAQAQFTFDLDVATDAPTLNDLTFSWVEGANVRAASVYYNQRYWLSVAINATANNRILLFDKRRQWQRYSGIAADTFVLFNSAMYFGSSSGIFQAESGYSDNGTAITAYYTTPTIAPGGFDTYSKFLNLYTITDNSDSTLTTSFYLEGDDDTTYSLGAQVMNAIAGIQNIKYAFPVTEIQQGRLINLKWQVPGTSFWRVLRGNLYFDRDAVPY